MKKALMFFGVILLACAAWTPTATAATEAQKLAAIQGGLAHLDYVQCQTAGSTFGSWSTSGCGGSYQDAYTAMSVFAFMARVSDWPAAKTTAYQTDVVNGVAYLLANASTATVSVNTDGVNICPGGSGTCTAIYWNISGEPTYATGFVAQALATFGLTQGAGAVADSNPKSVSHPLGGMTWVQVAQGITNAYAAAQQGSLANVIYDGGWRYSIPSTYTQADMSTTQWGAIACGYDESVGAVTPAYVKTHLKTYLANSIINNSGAACYTPGTGTCSIGPTYGENGGWLVSNSYVGQSPSAGVVSFLNTSWKTAANSYGGNFGHPYGMWATYKGVGANFGLADTSHITNKLTDCGVGAGNGPGATSQSGGVCSWWEDYNEWLVNGNTTIPNTQIATDGGGNKYWTGYSTWGDTLSTAVDVSILEAAVLPTTITTPPVTVPVLSEVGIGVLVLLLGLAGFMAMRTRRAHSS
jgi:hypothetical protein